MKKLPTPDFFQTSVWLIKAAGDTRKEIEKKNIDKEKIKLTVTDQQAHLYEHSKENNHVLDYRDKSRLLPRLKIQRGD